MKWHKKKEELVTWTNTIPSAGPWGVYPTPGLGGMPGYGQPPAAPASTCPGCTDQLLNGDEVITPCFMGSYTPQPSYIFWHLKCYVTQKLTEG